MNGCVDECLTTIQPSTHPITAGPAGGSPLRIQSRSCGSGGGRKASRKLLASCTARELLLPEVLPNLSAVLDDLLVGHAVGGPFLGRGALLDPSDDGVQLLVGGLRSSGLAHRVSLFLVLLHSGSAGTQAARVRRVWPPTTALLLSVWAPKVRTIPAQGEALGRDAKPSVQP